FKKLSLEEFSKVQFNVFPTYFKFQIVSPLILGLLSPYKYCPFTLGALVASSISGLINLVFVEPACHSIKEERIKLTAINKDKKENGELSDEMQALNKKFGRWHGLSLLANLVSIFSLGAYGLASAKALSRLPY
ncbi:hypothetical protein KGF56_003393, partial [Candida oxycetoniae]